MTCNGCRKTIEELLASHPSVTHVSVDLASHSAEITMLQHVPLAEFRSLLAPHANYAISELNTETSDDKSSAAAKEHWLSVYKPVLLIAVILFITSVLTSFQSDEPLMMGMRVFMAGFFLTFGFFKLLDLRSFAIAYQGYDLLAAKWYGYGLLYPFIEMLLGFAYVSNIAPQTTNILTLVVMGFSSVGVIRSVMNKKSIQCACLGTVFKLPMSTVTIIEDLSMVGMAAFMLIE